MGPSGQLLNAVLAEHGIDRSKVYVDNVCACRPADNRTPTTAEIKCCYPRLKTEIVKRDPKQIIALGATAAQAVMKSNIGITQLRVGPPKTSEEFPGVEIIPTFHPAACLYAADYFPHLVTDIGKAVGGVHIRWEPPTVTVVDNPPDAIRALREIEERYDTLTIDIEVGIEKEIHFGHPEQYQMLCIGIGYKPGFALVIGENACADNQVKERFKRLFQLNSKKWIAHNGKFDMAGLYGYSGVAPRLYFDTMLASYVVDERPGTHGLKYLAVELLGAPQYDLELTRYVNKNDSYAVVPRPVLYQYNGYDVACTYLLYEKYRQELDDTQRKLHDFLVEASEPLMWTEMEGIKVDDAYSEQLMVEYLDRLEKMQDDLKPWVANPRSPKQVKEALHDMGFRVMSTDVEHLKNIADRVAPDSDTNAFIQQMLLHRRAAKLYGTYVKGIRKRTYQGRVHSTFLLHGSVTGRLASRNPNMHNIPRESSIRRQFIPNEGNVFVSADYATIELRTMAVEAQDEFLANIFREGRDIHNEFSLVFYGPEFTKDQRVRTKAFVFGSAYGREPYSIAQEYKIPLREAEDNQNKFFAMMPGIIKYRQEIEYEVLQGEQELQTRFGRKRRFMLITDANKRDVVKEGLAFIPQSTASDINLHAFIRLRRDHGLHTRQPIHDSNMVECSEADAEDVARLMKKVMEETATELMGDFVPFPVDVRIGKNWGEV